MKNKAIFLILAVLFCGVAAAGAVSVNNLKDQISEMALLKEQISTLESENAAMRGQLEDIEAADQTLGDQITALSTTVESLIDTETDALVEQCIAEIDSIGEITFEDEALIADLEATYAGMTEKQKNKLVNYVELKNARRALNRLVEETAPEGKYVYLNGDWNGYHEFVPSDARKTEGEILEYRETSDGYKLAERMKYTIDGNLLKLEDEEETIYVHNGNIIMADGKCEGKIPETDLFNAEVTFDGGPLVFHDDGTVVLEDARSLDLVYSRDGDVIVVTDGAETASFYVYEGELYYNVLVKE